MRTRHSRTRKLTFSPNRCWWMLCLLVVSDMLVACYGVSFQPPGLSVSRPLTGRIWDVSANVFVDSSAMIAQMASADFILLGEQHDNPEQHRLQAEIVRNLIARGRHPAIAFEMLSIDQSEALANYLARAPKDAAGLGAAVNWDTSGWPAWAMYQPIADAAIAAKVPIVPANLPLSLARAMARDSSALDAAARRQLGLDQPLSSARYAAMAEDIRVSHCGYVPEESIKPMVDVQRARDAQMAHSLIVGATTDGAILIAGAGHVRRDYGVPVYLQARAPQKRVISVAFVEVEKGKQNPLSYNVTGSVSRAPFDYFWFTPRVDDTNPCEKFKQQFDQFKKTS